MKKVSREKLINLLKNKGNQTFLELSLKTGYHEKSLVRISKQLKNDDYSLIHRNKYRSPKNRVNDEKRRELIELFENGNYKTKKEFYLENANYSYSFLCKLIKKKKSKKIAKPKNKCLVVKRKMIADNVLQYNNTRYVVLCDEPIFHHESVLVVLLEKSKEPLCVKYKNKRYEIVILKQVHSLKGNTKYS